MVKPAERELALLKEKAEAADAHHRKMLSTIVPYSNLGELPVIVQEQMANLSHDTRKPKVCAFYYGGTLGMHWEDQKGIRVLVPTEDARELLEPLQKWHLEDRMQIVWFPVLRKPIDSTNGRFPHWVTIGNAMRLLYDYFDGFVTAGGTDSLRFMAAAMNFMFPNLGKPNIAAAAQKEASGWGSDAPENLAFGFESACADISGTHLAMSRRLLHGLHLFKIKDTAYEAFDAPPQHVLGHFEGKVITYPNCPRRNPLVNATRLQFNPNFRDGIVPTEISPFTTAKTLLHMSQDPDAFALLLLTYGAGNVRNEPMYEGELTHIDVIKQLHKNKFPLVLGSPMQDGKVNSPYEPGAEAINAGAISGGDTTGAALFVKMSRVLHDCWFTKERSARYLQGVSDWERSQHQREHGTLIAESLYGVDYYAFRKMMYQNIVGELNMNLSDKVK